MLRGYKISKEEIIKLLDLKVRHNPEEIFKKSKRSLKSVHRILRNCDKYCSKKRTDRQRITSKRIDRIILDMTSRNNISLQKIAFSLVQKCHSHRNTGI